VDVYQAQLYSMSEPEEDEQSGPTKEEWTLVRKALKNGLLSNEIPAEPTEMRPKEVWQKYVDHPDMGCVDYTNKQVRDKYTRILRSLRKKHKDGDLENEDMNALKVIVWAKSAAKQFLKKCFREKVISPDYKDAKKVWKDHCENHRAFARMSCDDAFVRRLGTVREDYIKKLARMMSDLKAHDIAKKNHPTPEFNIRGEPQWHGSAAQRRLKAMVAEGKHEGKEPKSLYLDAADFQVYSLQTFRDHIYQEERLLKFNRYVEGLQQAKKEKLQY